MGLRMSGGGTECGGVVCKVGARGDARSAEEPVGSLGGALGEGIGDLRWKVRTDF